MFGDANTEARFTEAHAIHLLQRGLLEGLGKRCAGVVHQHVKSSEARDGLFGRGFDGLDICSIRLNGDRLPAVALDCFHDRCGGVRSLRICDGHACSVACQALSDRSADATRAAGNESDFAFKFL